MDKQRFDLTEFFIKEKKCDFLFTVIMGTDRMPHLFYRYFDKDHIRYTPHPVYKDALKNRHRFCEMNIKRRNRRCRPSCIASTILYQRGKNTKLTCGFLPPEVKNRLFELVLRRESLDVAGEFLQEEKKKNKKEFLNGRR